MNSKNYDYDEVAVKQSVSLRRFLGPASKFMTIFKDADLCLDSVAQICCFFVKAKLWHRKLQLNFETWAEFAALSDFYCWKCHMPHNRA